MLVPNPESPAALGFRMPAEWEPHAATWLTWPHNPETWPGKFDPVPALWARMASELSRGEDVHILSRDEAMDAEIRGWLDLGAAKRARVHLHRVASNDAWMRDHGPTFLVNDREGVLAGVDWVYNAWGGKYPPFDDDARIASLVCAATGAARLSPGVVLEGGAIDVNGMGTVLTTESCLLNPNRNPHLSRADVEQVLCDYLGVTTVLWLGDGIVGDDTDGHVDDITRFVGPRTVVTVVESDPADENFEPLRANRERLAAMTDQDGIALEVIELPMPRPIEFDGQRLPASYGNFYIGNEVVLVPVFEEPNDELAVATLERAFPQRRVVGIPAEDLVLGLGAFHCVTQQQPRV